jgi:hypothetical protein
MRTISQWLKDVASDRHATAALAPTGPTVLSAAELDQVAAAGGTAGSSLGSGEGSGSSGGVRSAAVWPPPPPKLN